MVCFAAVVDKRDWHAVEPLAIHSRVGDAAVHPSRILHSDPVDRRAAPIRHPETGPLFGMHGSTTSDGLPFSVTMRRPSIHSTATR